METVRENRYLVRYGWILVILMYFQPTHYDCAETDLVWAPQGFKSNFLNRNVGLESIKHISRKSLVQGHPHPLRIIKIKIANK